MYRVFNFESYKSKRFEKWNAPFVTHIFKPNCFSINSNFSRIFKNFRSLLTQSQAPQTHTGFVNVGSKMHCFTNRVFYLCNFQTEHPAQREHYFVRNKRTFRLCVTLLLNSKANSLCKNKSLNRIQKKLGFLTFILIQFYSFDIQFSWLPSYSKSWVFCTLPHL